MNNILDIFAAWLLLVFVVCALAFVSLPDLRRTLCRFAFKSLVRKPVVRDPQCKKSSSVYHHYFRVAKLSIVRASCGYVRLPLRHAQPYIEPRHLHPP